MNQQQIKSENIYLKNLKRFQSQDAILSTASNPPSPRKCRMFRHEVIDSDVFLPTKNRLIRHDVIDNDDIVFLSSTSRRSSSRMSTESEEFSKSRKKYRSTTFRRCSAGATFSTRQPLHGSL